MAEVIYLERGESAPDSGEDKSWVHVEANTTGLFYGTGAAWKASGEWIGYVSLSEDDVSLEKALAAALAWAERYGVQTVWVQREPWELG